MGRNINETDVRIEYAMETGDDSVIDFQSNRVHISRYCAWLEEQIVKLKNNQNYDKGRIN